MKFFSTLQAFAVIALGTAFLTAAAPVSSSEIQEKSAQGLRLLSLAEDADPVWKTEDEKLDLQRQDVHFFDVTETYELEQSLPKKKAAAVTCKLLVTVILFVVLILYVCLKSPPRRTSLLSNPSLTPFRSRTCSLTSLH